MPKFTFNGTMSGIHIYHVRVIDDDSINMTIRQGDEIDYQRDSHVIASGLSPGSEAKMSITAIGCMETRRTTEYFQVRTRRFDLASVEVNRFT